MLRSAQDCQAPELMLVGQAVVLEALEALEALALLLSSTLGLISLALALALVPSSAQHCQALELMLVAPDDAVGIGAACFECVAMTADYGLASC